MAYYDYIQIRGCPSSESEEFQGIGSTQATAAPGLSPIKFPEPVDLSPLTSVLSQYLSAFGVFRDTFNAFKTDFHALSYLSSGTGFAALVEVLTPEEEEPVQPPDLSVFSTYTANVAAWVSQVSQAAVNYDKEVQAYEIAVDSYSAESNVPAPIKPSRPDLSLIAAPAWDWALMAAAAAVSAPMAAVLLLIRVASKMWLAHKQAEIEKAAVDRDIRQTKALEDIVLCLQQSGLQMEIDTDSVGRVVRMFLKDGLAVNFDAPK